MVCNMWDAHHCATAARRVAEMVPCVNVVLGGLRLQGAFLIHAPGGCTAFYAGTLARLRAIQTPFAAAPDSVAWHEWEPDELAALPATLTAPEPCSCDTVDPLRTRSAG
jgi:hypothetical protein